MGFNQEIMKKEEQLQTGVHLVTITEASILKDADKNPVVTPSGDTCLVIKFSDSYCKTIEQTYYIGGDKEWLFKKMCAHAEIDLEKVAQTGKFKAEAVGKRLWLFVKELHDIDGEDHVLDETTGQPVIHYLVFGSMVCSNPENRPNIKGDPKNNGGEPYDEFIGYRQVDNSVGKSRSAIIAKPVTKPIETDDFADLDLTVKTTAGEVKGNKAFVEVYQKIEESKPKEEKQITPDTEVDWDDF